MTHDLRDGDAVVEAAQDLCQAVNGVDWSAERVQAALSRLLRSRNGPAVDEAMARLIARLESSDPADQDGVAMVALAAGTLVERGQPPEGLATVLLEKLLAILPAARRYADGLIADMPEFASEEAKEAHLESRWQDAMVSVDHEPITGEMIRSRIELDRTGAVALAYLEKWVLATVAAVTRSRAQLEAACQSKALLEATESFRDSTANWLFQLFRTELDAEWLLVCPQEGRAFNIRIDGASLNFNLNEVVTEVLAGQGIAGAESRPGVAAYLRGERDEPPVDSIVGAFSFYDYRALGYDLSEPRSVPQDFWVWNEGIPADVATFQGLKMLVAGPAAYRRSWNLARSFEALPISASVERELSPGEYQDLVARVRTGG